MAQQIDYRNPVYTASGDIDCEIDHPQLGWIPFTASANDPELYGREIFAKITDAGGIGPYVPPPPELMAMSAPVSTADRIADLEARIAALEAQQ